MSDEDALPMLPKEDCVLSILFFLGGVRSGGLMVTMLPRGGGRRGGGSLGGSEASSPRRLPGSLAARADRLHSTMIHEPSAATPRRGRRAPLVKFDALAGEPEPEAGWRPLFCIDDMRPPEASPMKNATAFTKGGVPFSA